MDGFEFSEGVIIVVVINWLDVFDFVLFCSGCFDCCVMVNFLDVVGCKGIFEVYMC